MSTTPTLDKMIGLMAGGKLTVDNMVNTLSYVQVYIIHTASYNGTLKGYVDNKTASYAVDLVNAYYNRADKNKTDDAKVVKTLSLFMNKEFQAFKSATETFAKDVAQDYYKSIVELLMLVSRGEEFDYAGVTEAAEKMAEAKKELVSMKKSQAFVEKEYYLQTFADIYVDAAVEAIVTGALAMAQAFVEKVGNEIRKLH
jgi:hypothetical protein